MIKTNLRKLLLFLMVGFLFTACQSQKVSKHDPASKDPTGIKTDPMFFIPGQLCQHVREIFQDSQGRLWFGTNVYDIMLYEGDSLRFISGEEGGPDGRITGILEDNQGNIWFGSAFGLTRFDGEDYKTFEAEEGLINTEIWRLFLDARGTFWIGTT